VGHQLVGASAATSLRRLAALLVSLTVAVVGCGGDDGDDAIAPPDPLDIARQQAEARDPVADPAGAATASAADPAATVASASTVVVDELPPPDASAFVGANRIVNLWVGPGGTTQIVDVWARRTFTNGPVLLVKDLAYGQASGYVAAPANHEIAVVGSGAGPDGLELASVTPVAAGGQVTTVFTNADDTGAGEASAFAEQLIAPPADGAGLVVLAAVNTDAFQAPLTLALGGWEFAVGDGSESCLPQRIEAAGFAPVLVGADRVEVDVAPGLNRFTLHGAPSPTGCAEASLLDIPLDIVAGSATLVLVSTRDGESLQATWLPITVG
jgi:hypothetical protein